MAVKSWKDVKDTKNTVSKVKSARDVLDSLPSTGKTGDEYQQYAEAMKSSRLQEVSNNTSDTRNSKKFIENIDPVKKLLTTKKEEKKKPGTRLENPTTSITKWKDLKDNFDSMTANSTLSSRKALDEEYAKTPEGKLRNLPVLGPIAKGLDRVAEATKPAADIALEYYTPGAGLGVLNSATQSAGNLVSKVAPWLLGRAGTGTLDKLSRVGGKIAHTAATEAIVGLPTGAGQVLANNPQASGKEILTGAGYGAGGGAVLGGLVPAVGAVGKKVIKTAREVFGSRSGAIDSVIRDVPEATQAVRGAEEVANDVPVNADRVADVTQPVTTPIKYRDIVAATQEPRVQGVRANFANQLENGNFSPELQQGIRNTDQSYDIKTNQSSVNAADEALKDLPAAESNFLLNQSGGAEHIATGYKLMQRLDAQGEHARALVVARKLAEDLTTSGQTSQAASILSRLSPEGQLLNLVRQAERNGKEVTEADSIKFKELAAKVQENAGAGIKANQFNEILDRMERGDNVSVADIKKLSDYLSGAEKVVKPSKVVDDLPTEFKDVKKRDKIISFLDDAEQAALARIKARKNNLNALPINEWADHAIVVSAQIAKGTIRAATHVEDLVKMFGEEIRPVATQVYRQAKRLVNGVSTSAAQGDLLKANKAFERISGQQKGNLQEKIVEKYLKENPKVSQKDINSLRELAKNITRLSGDAKIDADIAMQKILNSYEKSSAWDKSQALRYMGMLLNTHTQAINALSGPIMSTTGYVADVFGTMLDIAMNKTLKTPRTTTLYGSNPLRFMAKYMKNLATGAKAGFQGVNPAGIQGTNEIRGLAFKSLKNPLTFVPAMGERVLGAVSKGPDFATYKSVFDSEIAKQGFLSAKNKGIKGRANINKHVREFVNDPPEEAILQADRIGKNTTFQRSDTSGGKAANWLNQSPNIGKPLVNAVFPFVRTPINIASTAVTMTPAGIIKGLFQLTSMSKASQREAIRTLSMGVTGTGIGAVGYYLSQLGIITGANDSGDKDVDNIREQAGKGKYRFNTSALTRYLGAMLNGEGSEAAEKAAQYREGDKQFDYNKLQPLAFPLAIGAGIEGNKEKGLSGSLQGAGTDAYGSLYGMSTLKGVQSVFQPSYGGTMGEKALGFPSRVAESFFKSFSPGGLAQEARRQDPIQRKTPFNDGPIVNTKEYFRSRIPGLSQDLPSRKTTLGQDYLNAPEIKGSYLNPYRSEVAPYNKAAEIISGLIDRTGDKSLAPSAPEKSVRGKDSTGASVSFAIPADRYAKLQEDVGNEIIKRITALPSSDDKTMATAIEDIYTEVRKEKMNEVKTELGIQVSR